MTLHLGLHSSIHNRHGQQQQEIRDARKILKECVRTDWDYPRLPTYQTNKRVRPNDRPDPNNVDGVETKMAGFRLHHTSGMYLKPKDWTLREYSCESSSDDSEHEKGGSNSKKDSSSSSPQELRSRREKGEWKFEGPDSVGTEIEDRQNARKRKRQQALQEEMAWNDGLALWAARRDAWCEARTIEQIRAAELGSPSSSSSLSSADEISPKSTNSTTGIAAAVKSSLSSSSPSSGSTPRSSTSTSTRTDSAISPATTPDLEPRPSTSNLLKPSTSQATTASSTTPGSSEILIPIAQPLLANHPIRRRITSAIWPEIYNKIVLQGRAPSVPINLLTLTHALVQGWQSEGEWPPKPGPIERAFTHKKGDRATAAGGGGKVGNGDEAKTGGGLRTGVRAAVGRVLRITSEKDSGVVPSAHR